MFLEDALTEAQKTSEEYEKELVEEIMPPAANVSVLDAARMPTRRSNMGMVKSFILFSLVGLVLGFGFVTVLYYFDTTIKTVEQIEGKFDVPILGSVPDYNETKSLKKRGKRK